MKTIISKNYGFFCRDEEKVKNFIKDKNNLEKDKIELLNEAISIAYLPTIKICIEHGLVSKELECYKKMIGKRNCVDILQYMYEKKIHLVVDFNKLINTAGNELKIQNVNYLLNLAEKTNNKSRWFLTLEIPSLITMLNLYKRNEKYKNKYEKSKKILKMYLENDIHNVFDKFIENIYPEELKVDLRKLKIDLILNKQESKVAKRIKI